MNNVNGSSQMQSPSNTTSVEAAQLETDTAVLHQQPQGINSNMRLSSLKLCDSDSEKSVESSNILYFPLPGKQQNVAYYVYILLLCSDPAPRQTDILTIWHTQNCPVVLNTPASLPCIKHTETKVNLDGP